MEIRDLERLCEQLHLRAIELEPDTGFSLISSFGSQGQLIACGPVLHLFLLIRLST